MNRYFKHKNCDLILVADESAGQWVAQNGAETAVHTSVFKARDGESLVANGLYEEVKELPVWAAECLAHA